MYSRAAHRHSWQVQEHFPPRVHPGSSRTLKDPGLGVPAGRNKAEGVRRVWFRREDLERTDGRTYDGSKENDEGQAGVAGRYCSDWLQGSNPILRDTQPQVTPSFLLFLPQPHPTQQSRLSVESWACLLVVPVLATFLRILALR